MVLEKNIYDKIRDIINLSDQRVRASQLKERESEYFVGGKKFLIDIPKKEKIFYHGSHYIIDCDEINKKCRTAGELVTVLKSGNNVKERLECLSCEVLAIHDHDTITSKSTHVHFRCEDKDYNTTLNIVKLIRGY